MTSRTTVTSRRDFLLSAGATTFALMSISQVAGAAPGLTGILAKASDSALNKLAQPNAFFNDEDVRIGLPFIGGQGGGLGKLASRASGLLGGLGGNKNLDLFAGITRKMNDVAGVAANEAKPIFRQTIDGLRLSDAPGILKKNNGATQYLRTSAWDTLYAKMRPLVDKNMNEIGVYSEFNRLSGQNSLLKQAGITQDSLGKSVTEQALNGMFAYIGKEEANFRANPLGKASKLFGGLLK